MAPLFPPPAERWVAWDDFRREAQAWAGIALTPFAPPPREPTAGHAPPSPLLREIPTTSIESYRGRITGFLEDLDVWRRKGERVVLVARSEAQGRRLTEILRDHDLGARLGRELPEPGGISLWIGELTAGFRIAPLQLTLITEQEVFGAHAVLRRRARPKEALPFSSFADLKVGDYVVHVDHGIAQYRGLEQLAVGGQDGDFLHLRYAGNDTLYVPVSKFHLVQRYVAGESAGAHPALDRLGGTSWAKAKERVRASVREMAGELLRLYAARQVLHGNAFPADSPLAEGVRGGVPLRRDARPAPGHPGREAGHGGDPSPWTGSSAATWATARPRSPCAPPSRRSWTESRWRCWCPPPCLPCSTIKPSAPALPASRCGWRCSRRFRPTAEQQAGRARTHRGRRGHRHRDPSPAPEGRAVSALGLLVVDEEQRFGVAAKEALKQLRREVDVLTLTATPIPRTLHMAMLGVRDISTIETPPEERLAIRTYVTPYDPDVIGEAIQRELARGRPGLLRPQPRGQHPRRRRGG